MQICQSYTSLGGKNARYAQAQGIPLQLSLTSNELACMLVYARGSQRGLPRHAPCVYTTVHITVVSWDVIILYKEYKLYTYIAHYYYNIHLT